MKCFSKIYFRSFKHLSVCFKSSWLIAYFSMFWLFILSVIMLHYAECHSAWWHCAESHGTQNQWSIYIWCFCATFKFQFQRLKKISESLIILLYSRSFRFLSMSISCLPCSYWLSLCWVSFCFMICWHTASIVFLSLTFFRTF
jgi:hypothetical protein